MVVSAAAPPRAAATLQRNWVPLRESPTAYEVSRAASRALVRRQLAHPSSLTGASAWSKCPLGSAPARLLCLLRARLMAAGSSALPGRDQPTGRPATAPGARARRRCHRFDHAGASPEMPTISSETLTAFLSDLRLDSFEPLLARLPAGTFVGATGPPIGSTDLRRFVAGVVRVSQRFVVGLRPCTGVELRAASGP